MAHRSTDKLRHYLWSTHILVNFPSGSTEYTALSSTDSLYPLLRSEVFLVHYSYQLLFYAQLTHLVGSISNALPQLLGEIDTSAYYVEYFEREVLDESSTLADLGVPQGGVISLRPYDMDHPPPFEG